MPEAMAEALLGVKHFKDWTEVEAVQGFVAGHLVDEKNFEAFLGHYEGLKDTVRCCLRKPNGNPCNHEHRFGYVARTVDGNVTVIGNDCVKIKFEGGDSRMRVAAAHYRNERVAEQRRVQYADRMARRQSIEEELAGKLRAVGDLSTRMLSLAQQLGRYTLDRLASMAKAGSSAVVVEMLTVRKAAKKEDDDDVDFAEVTLGRLQSLALLSRETYTPVRLGVMRVLQAFSDAVVLRENERSRKFADALARIDEYQQVLSDADGLLAMEEGFKGNDLKLLCYLSRNQEEREQAAALCLKQQGHPSHRDAVLKLLRTSDNTYVQQFNATRLRIP